MEVKHKAMDVANFYIHLANSLPNDYIDNLKLNKLCFYAQGWSLVKLGHPLFGDDIEAWRYGPVIRSIYNAYKGWADQPIQKETYYVDESRFTSPEISLLIDVYMTYGKYTSFALMQKTHAPGTPWANVYDEQSLDTQITKEDIRDFFLKNNELESLIINPAKIVTYE